MIRRNMYQQFSRTTSPTRRIHLPVRPWSWLYGIPLDRRSTTVSDLFRTQRQTSSLSALLSIVPTRLTMSSTRYVIPWRHAIHDECFADQL